MVSSMKRTLKISLSFVIGFLLVIIIYLNYQSHFSEEAKNGKKNIVNAENIEIGMTEEQVISIMGKPDTIQAFEVEKIERNKYYYYSTNDESHPSIEITFDSAMRVKRVSSPSY